MPVSDGPGVGRTADVGDRRAGGSTAGQCPVQQDRHGVAQRLGARATECDLVCGRRTSRSIIASIAGSDHEGVHFLAVVVRPPGPYDHLDQRIDHQQIGL